MNYTELNKQVCEYLNIKPLWQGCMCDNNGCKTPERCRELVIYRNVTGGGEHSNGSELSTLLTALIENGWCYTLTGSPIGRENNFAIISNFEKDIFDVNASADTPSMAVVYAILQARRREINASKTSSIETPAS